MRDASHQYPVENRPVSDLCSILLYLLNTRIAGFGLSNAPQIFGDRVLPRQMGQIRGYVPNVVDILTALSYTILPLDAICYSGICYI